MPSNSLAPLSLLIVVLVTSQLAMAETVSFGAGEDKFEMEFVTVGNLGNPPDERLAIAMGAVEYEFQIGKYEAKCLMTRTAGLADTQNFCRGREDKPADLSWVATARFVNWLNTSTGHPPAYKLKNLDFGVSAVLEFWEPGEPGYNPDNVTRNALAKYVIPDLDEWHKAAFYDPTSGTYNDWATGNVEPGMLGPEGGTEPNTAVYGPKAIGGLGSLADVTRAGGLSAYGTMGQTGNQQEWEEGPFVPDVFLSGTRAKRLGADSTVSAVQLRATNDRQQDLSGLGGFRVVALSQPDPLPGDTNADGLVNLDDFLQLSEHFGEPGTYADGDFNRDGFVRFDDFLILSHNFGTSREPALAAVPEPASISLLMSACLELGLFRRRRRSRS